MAVVDDIPTYRRFFADAIAARSGLAAVLLVESVDELVEAVDSGLGVDVAMVDLRLERGLDGPAGVARVAAAGLRVLVFSENRDPDLVRASLAAGAAGYVSKNESPEEILDALELVASGDSYLSPRFAADLLVEARAAATRYAISDAQRQVLELIADGMTYGQIAERRYVSLKTVQNQVNAIAQHVRDVNPEICGDRNPRTFLRDVAEELGLRRTWQPDRP